MQTFLPHSDFKRSAQCLDYRRLGKQRVEAMQLLKALRDEKYRWRSHPAAKMWMGYEEALSMYMDVMIDEWVARGYKNTMVRTGITTTKFPPWLGDEGFHAAHRSNLLRKDREYYSKFGWTESDDLPYVWPESKKIL